MVWFCMCIYVACTPNFQFLRPPLMHCHLSALSGACSLLSRAWCSCFILYVVLEDEFAVTGVDSLRPFIIADPSPPPLSPPLNPLCRCELVSPA
jgi:hypothetical protein